MNIGNMLKEVRTYDLVTQKEIAKVMGISEKTYGLYEIQYKIIPMKHLITFSDYFHVSIDYLFQLVNDRKKLNGNLVLKSLIVERLKDFRKDQALSQAQLSQITNLDRSTITKYEKGLLLISTSFLYTICKKYGISADYLLGKVDSPKYLK